MTPAIGVIVGLAVAAAIGYAIGSLRPAPTVLVVPGQPSSVSVERYEDYAALTAHAPANSRVVVEQPQLLHLLQELNGLPPFPAGTVLCPGNPEYYLLAFLYANQDRLTVEIDSTCGRVQVAGENRAIARATGSPILADLKQLVG